MAWDAKKTIAAPLIVAALIFLGGLAKDPLLQLFGLEKEPENFPLHCVAEPYVENGRLVADLYLINTSDAPVEKADILRFGELLGRETPARIRLVWRDDRRGTFVGLERNKEFNKGKAALEYPSQKGRELTIDLVRIESKAVLRWKLVTDNRIMPLTRGAKDSIPFDIYLAGTQVQPEP